MLKRIQKKLSMNFIRKHWLKKLIWKHNLLVKKNKLKNYKKKCKCQMLMSSKITSSSQQPMLDRFELQSMKNKSNFQNHTNSDRRNKWLMCPTFMTKITSRESQLKKTILCDNYFKIFYTQENNDINLLSK